MGNCCGNPADPDNTKVQKELERDFRKDALVIKLLLLGSGGSGKSTLFKQLQYIHGDGFNDRQKRMFQAQIHEQLIESMKLLITKCEDFFEDDPEINAKYKLYDYDYEENINNNNNNNNNSNESENKSSDNQIRISAEAILSIRQSQRLSKEIVEYLRMLWNNETIQAMFAIRNEICVPDSTEYFFKDLDRITDDSYVPSDKDLIMVRYRTTGMQEKDFTIKGHIFKICDVGGQRNERRKWIHFFNNVTSVIFVVSLSCYDEVIFESEDNAMVESLEVFQENVNSVWFNDIPFILFLNKSDLYVVKVNNVPISVAPCFESYSGPPNDAQASLAYIKEVFNSANKNSSRSIFTHVTNATDKDQIEKVFNDVQTMIINWSLERAGLT